MAKRGLVRTLRVYCGLELTKLMDEQEMGVSTLADLLKIPVQTVHHMRENLLMVRYSQVVTICEQLGVKIKDLCGNEFDAVPPEFLD